MPLCRVAMLKYKAIIRLHDRPITKLLSVLVKSTPKGLRPKATVVFPSMHPLDVSTNI